MGQLKCDLIKKLITLISDYIQRLSLLWKTKESERNKDIKRERK
jgi:hypothetical protein